MIALLADTVMTLYYCKINVQHAPFCKDGSIRGEDTRGITARSSRLCALWSRPSYHKSLSYFYSHISIASMQNWGMLFSSRCAVRKRVSVVNAGVFAFSGLDTYGIEAFYP